MVSYFTAELLQTVYILHQTMKIYCMCAILLQIRLNNGEQKH